ncbi:3-oxoacyl-ACP synthase [Kouleothrix aurantiaca]|jgi:3-oxoacyl-[acyl-carrier-protein] synthase-3|uniref:3-oxoacyl-ACP synthase n=1 Tax=Kouleothrix aurantiaca TaxID=186479 RepID=A0A0P9HBX5_9CHLR|nr:3-oxoacyl-ACP synthase [Kouleothrix aurantiaca]
MLFQNVAIEAIAYELAPHRVTSDDLEGQMAATMQRIGIPAGRLEALSGIRERRFWDHGTMPSDVATLAARKLLDQTGIDPKKIGALINTSVCKDYIEPSVACLVHGNLGLPPSCVNYDISNACLGFLNGMTSVGMQIEAGLIDYALVVDGEGSQEAVMATVRRLQSETTTPQEFRDNFATLTLGSGAVAMLLCRKELSTSGHSLNGAVTMAATQHNRLCVGQPDYMKTDASALLIAGVQLAGETWRAAADELPNWSDAEIAMYIPHQVGARHMAAVAEALEIKPNKLHLNFPTLGNIGPAALPITLAMADEAGRIKKGDNVALLGIGSGLNCSMMSVTW